MPYIIGAAVLGSAVLGAVGANDSNRRSQKAVNRQYKYDKEAYAMNNEKMEADYEYLVESILSQERNFDTQRAYKDQLATDTYNRELQIAQIERQTNARAYAKSEQIYGTTLGLNAVERQYSQDAAYRQRREIQQAAAFDNQQAIIESLQAQGTALARGQAGRSAGKIQQAERMKFGMDQAVLAASLLSADENLQSTLRDIELAYDTANMQADANRMLPPPPVLDPIVPMASPDMEFLLPRELQDFDFGPEPIKGVASYTNPWLTFAQTALSGVPAVMGAVNQKNPPSDIRLKEKIERVGTSPSGIPIYEFNYKGQPFRYRGAMAQDLLETHPEAVGTRDGHYTVDYNMIDVDMVQIN